MPSSVQQSPAYVRRSWPAIVWIVLAEILVLVALSAAFVGYVNWSSDAAFAEFKAAVHRTAPQPESSVQAVRAHAPCSRKA